MKRILFVCVENSCRSQMAEGFARALAPGAIEAFSAGSRPSGEVDPRAIAFMRERGIDISGHRSKGFGDLPVREFDVAVSMGCADVCPFVPGARRIAWEIPDPKGLDDGGFRAVRDEIGRKVAELLSVPDAEDDRPGSP
ncbi:MAG: arsenate reductase ArsC [bacterium]|nr:arsenate reductase ArsC [bacterium]